MSFRAESAGYQLGGAVVEMVNLMYQNSTAAKFYSGLVPVLNLEIERRSLNNKVVKITSTNIGYMAVLSRIRKVIHGHGDSVTKVAKVKDILAYLNPAEPDFT